MAFASGESYEKNIQEDVKETPDSMGLIFRLIGGFRSFAFPRGSFVVSIERSFRSSGRNIARGGLLDF